LKNKHKKTGAAAGRMSINARCGNLPGRFGAPNLFGRTRHKEKSNARAYRAGTAFFFLEVNYLR
jgi:hypothetical protein